MTNIIDCRSSTDIMKSLLINIWLLWWQNYYIYLKQEMFNTSSISFIINNILSIFYNNDDEVN